MKASFTKMSLIVPIVALAAMAAACSHDKGGSGAESTIQLADPGPAAEVVNGDAVPERLVAALARSRNWDLSKPEVRDRTQKELANYVIAVQAAHNEKFFTDPDFVAQVELIRLQAISSATVGEFQKRAAVDDATLKADYDKQVARNSSAFYDYSQIVFGNQADATKAASEIAGGKNFEKIAEGHKGQVLQVRKMTHVRSGQLGEPLAKALEGLKPGETSKTPVQTPLGWLVVRMDGVNATPPPPFETQKEVLRRTALKRAGEERMMKLRAEAKITPSGPAAGTKNPVPPAASTPPPPAKPAADDASKPKN